MQNDRMRETQVTDKRPSPVVRLASCGGRPGIWSPSIGLLSNLMVPRFSQLSDAGCEEQTRNPRQEHKARGECIQNRHHPGGYPEGPPSAAGGPARGTAPAMLFRHSSTAAWTDELVAGTSPARLIQGSPRDHTVLSLVRGVGLSTFAFCIPSRCDSLVCARACATGLW